MGLECLTRIGEFKCNYHETMQFDWKGRTVALPASNRVEVGSCAQLSVVILVGMEQIGASYDGDESIQQLIIEAALIKRGPKEYYMTRDMLKHKGKWVIGSGGDMRKLIFAELHNDGIGGHSGRETLKKIKEYLYWPTINQAIGQWVRECIVC